MGFLKQKMTATLGSGVDFAIGIEDGSALQVLVILGIYTNASCNKRRWYFYASTGSASKLLMG